MSDQLSSRQWLKVHGLEATGLSLSQILCSLGFQQCSGEVQSLGRAVASKYGTGLFLQHPDQDGHVYNLVNADEKKLSELEARLIAVTVSLKQRLQWLNSGSRKTCGILIEKRVLLVLLGERKAKMRVGPSSALRAVINLLKEQGTNLTHLNIMSGSAAWKLQLTEVTEEVIAEANQWLLDNTLTFTQDTMSAITGAFRDEQLEAVYLIVGDQIKEELNDLGEKVLQQHLSIPVHVVVVDCKCPTALETCKGIASASGGRCHADGGKGALCLPRPDVLDIWEELEQARNTLAQVQALHMEVAERKRSFHEKINKIDKSESAAGSASSKQTKIHKTVVPKVVHSKRGIPSNSSSGIQSHTRSIRNKTRKSVKCHNFRKVARQDTTPHQLQSQEQPTLCAQPRMPARHTGGVAKGSTVLACCKQDGLYYKGRIVRNVSCKSADVEFLDCSHQITQLSQLILIGGAGPRPLLKSDDSVLCCVRQKYGRFCSKYGLCDFYIPATVQVVSTDSCRGHAIFTVVTFNGEQISCTRSGLEKISKSRYQATCSKIWQYQQTTQPETNTQQEDQISEEASTKRPTSGVYHTTDQQSPQYGKNGTSVGSTEEVTITACHVIQEREDRSTVTDSPETVERGTSVCASNQEQAVGTGPEKMDKSTSTENADLLLDTTDLSAAAGLRDTTKKDGNDFCDFPDSGQHIFCRRPEDGWYYRACVLQRGNPAGSSWIVRAESGEITDVPDSDVIADSISHPILVGATVLGPHPLFPGTFAPGNVMSVDSQNSSCCLQLYDSFQTHCPCDEVEFISLTRHKTAVRLLQERDSSWIGQAVVARWDSDGVYYPAAVLDKLVRQHFQLQWSDMSYQKQSILHMFGPLTRRRALHAGDHVLALAMPGIGACLPATVTSTLTAQVEVRFSDGERQTVSKEQCFWISPTYFISAVEYISRAFSSTSN